MEAVSDHFAHSGPSEPEKKILIGRVSSILDGTVYINKDTFFGLEDTVSEGIITFLGRCSTKAVVIMYSAPVSSSKYVNQALENENNE